MLYNGTRRAGETSAFHYGLWREIETHRDPLHVIFGSKMATETFISRSQGPKGWSSARLACCAAIPVQLKSHTGAYGACEVLFCGAQVEFYASSTDLMQRKYGYDAIGSRCTLLDYGFGSWFGFCV